jgi:hypothetical protein
MDGNVTISPVFSSALSVADLVIALENGLAAVPAQPRIWTTLRDYQSPIRLAAKVRTERQFERGLRMCTLTFDDDGYEIFRWIPLPKSARGFSLDHEWKVVLPCPAPLEVVAAALLEAFADPKWPTR